MSTTELIKRLKQNFDDYAHTIEGVEVWFARDLQKLLGYDKWQRFQGVIAKAEIACEQAGNHPADHFTGAGKMVKIGSETQREVKDYLLTRYACYLVAQNGDPRKKEIAFAMTYFAVQTRKMEGVRMIGKTILHYKILEKLPSTGSGQAVWVVWASSLPREIKMHDFFNTIGIKGDIHMLTNYYLPLSLWVKSRGHKIRTKSFFNSVRSEMFIAKRQIKPRKLRRSDM